ncbi:MAG: pilus assembly protein TadG-related protein [Bdellovibrionota bacterium]
MAIFVALIFQLLFLFFAMIINVGLLVHHKINLQNSVDLAAYYGAMKQAEMLNAMSHVNYQIRQSWKLLAWRYRVVGSGGADETGFNPYNRNTQQLDPGLDREGPHPTIANAYKTPVFCGTYAPLQAYDSAGAISSDDNENLCRGILSGGTRIQLFEEPKISASFIGLAVATSSFTRQLINIAQKRCEWSGYFNFMTLGSWVVGFNFDQLSRRLLIAKMAKGLSVATDDFIDIDGDSGKEGVKNTLLNNLTEANRDSVQFEMINGFRQGGCYGSPAGEFDPPAWLSEVAFFPAFIYQDNNCSDKKVLEPVAKLLAPDKPPNVMRNNFETANVTQISPFLGMPSPPYQYTLGYEKNPWCMGYVGVKAKTKPKIPFSPADFELTARAFAKPFGGRFGPWYFKNWQSGSPRSTGSNESLDEKTDPLAPPRLTDPSQIGNPASDQRVANYSRFVGDRLGLMSMLPLGQYIRALHNKSFKIIINDWDHLIFDRNSQKLMLPQENKIRDVMAWGWLTNQKPDVRDIEVSAVAPDQFDITYYSIDANFYDNYFKRMRDGKLLSKIGYTWPLRGDVGSRFESGPELEKFSVKDQIETVKTKIPSAVLDHDSKLTHIVRDPFHLLTSWTSRDLLDYTNIPAGKYFGGCIKPVSEVSSDKRIPFPGDCILGGRTGYSVKLISSDYLKANDLELGGPTAKGPIINPPDPSW